MPKLVSFCHGLSERDVLNQLTGWAGVNLAPEGIEEAKEDGHKIKEAGIEFGVACTSVLTRATEACNLILEYSDQLWVLQIRSWRLNERHYGKLRGLNKKETAEEYDDEQVHIWCRSYDTLPPLMEETDGGSAANNRRYVMLDKRDIPGGENLKVTLERASPFWQDEIAPALLDNKTILVIVHGDSLRAPAKHIEGISDKDIMDPEIPTGQSLACELNDDLTVTKKYYLQKAL